MIADIFNLQIRGIHGEHSESADHVYDISNKQRLGRSEIQLVEDMYTGIKAILDREFVLSKATNKPFVTEAQREEPVHSDEL